MTFEDWFYELEGFGLRAERFYDDFIDGDMEKMIKWLEAAYDSGKESTDDRI